MYIINNIENDQWKAVGSPPRRPSFSTTGTLGYTTNNNSMMSQSLRGSGVPSIIKEDSQGKERKTMHEQKYYLC